MQEVLVAAEPEAADLLAQHVESQRLMNETLKAELDKDGPTWTWAWRPFGMWLFLAMTAHLVVLVPFLNIILTSPVIMVLDVPTFVTLFLTYTGLYMGGHTAKSAVAAWKARDGKGGDIDLVYLLLALGAAGGGAYWKWGGQIGKVRDDLAAYKLHVVENFVSKAGHRESTAQLMDALSGVKSSVDGANQRIDQLLMANAKPTARTRS